MDNTVQSAQLMLKTLNSENLKTVIRFIQFLQSMQNERVAASQDNDAFIQLQNLFEDDKGGYLSEDDIVQDLAKFRRERMTK